MAYETVLLERDQGVGIITLNRPEVLNAMNYQLVGDLDGAITELEEDDSIGAIIVTGSGEKAFTAGGDIHEQRTDQHRPPEELAQRSEIRAGWSWHLASCRKPTIGAMNGLAYGGGGVLSTSLDMRVGCERTVFRFLAAAYGRLNTTWTLPMIVGWPIAKELLMTGRHVQPDEAYRLRLLNHLVPADQVMEKAMEIGTAIAAHRPESIQGIKMMLTEDIGSTWRDMWSREKEYLRQMESWTIEQSFTDFLARRGRD